LAAGRRGISGIILAGGSSRRMGVNKVELELGGVSVLQRVATTVSRVTDEIVIAAGHNRCLHLDVDVPVRWVPDPPGARGPLAGVVSGLGAVTSDVAIVVAADMPFLNERLLSYVADCLEGCDAAMPVIRGREQPTHAAYSRGCFSTAQSLQRLGAHSMHELLARLCARYIPESSCLELDPEGLSCFNMNTRDDLAFARQAIQTTPVLPMAHAI
jgi:molybdopterin-guanine dinucleotide biosynthesis protein A